MQDGTEVLEQYEELDALLDSFDTDELDDIPADLSDEIAGDI
jgi:hypothetical protein